MFTKRRPARHLLQNRSPLVINKSRALDICCNKGPKLHQAKTGLRSGLKIVTIVMKLVETGKTEQTEGTMLANYFGSQPDDPLLFVTTDTIGTGSCHSRKYDGQCRSQAFAYEQDCDSNGIQCKSSAKSLCRSPQYSHKY